MAGGILQGIGTGVSALLGAGGPIAGGILGQTKEQQPRLVSGIPSGAYDPVASLGSLDALTQLGYYDPSVLTAASPFNQALAKLSQTPMKAGVRAVNLGFISDIQSMIDRGMSPEEILSDPSMLSIQEYSGGKRLTPEQLEKVDEKGLQRRQALDWLAGTAGMGVEELLRQEFSHRDRIGQYEAEIGPLAETVREQRYKALTDLGGLREQMVGLSDIDARKAEEMTRLNREIEERRESELMRANVGGYNPAGALEGLEEMRADADLIALQRAIGLVSGQQGILGQQSNLLQGIISPGTQQATKLAGIRLGESAQPGQVTPYVAPNTALAQGVSAGSQGLANSLMDILSGGTSGGNVGVPAWGGAAQVDPGGTPPVGWQGGEYGW